MIAYKAMMCRYWKLQFPQLPIAPSDYNTSIFPISHHVSAAHPCDHEINGQF